MCFFRLFRPSPSGQLTSLRAETLQFAWNMCTSVIEILACIVKTWYGISKWTFCIDGLCISRITIKVSLIWYSYLFQVYVALALWHPTSASAVQIAAMGSSLVKTARAVESVRLTARLALVLLNRVLVVHKASIWLVIMCVWRLVTRDSLVMLMEPVRLAGKAQKIVCLP